MSQRSLLIFAAMIGLMSLYSIVAGRSEDIAAGAIGTVLFGSVAALVVAVGWVARKLTNSGSEAKPNSDTEDESG